MSVRKLIIAAAVLMLAVAACSDDDNPTAPSAGIVGSGIPASETRSVAVFHSVDLNAVGDVTVLQGAPQTLRVTVDDNIMQYITTTVTNGVLVIGVTPGVNLDRYDLVVDVTMPDIQGLSLTGVGSFRSVNLLQVDTLAVNLSGVATAILQLAVSHLTLTSSGVATMILSGTATTHDYTLSGEGTLGAFALDTDTSRVTISGVGPAELTASDQLDVTISGSGTVYYKGTPTVNANITGTGQIIDSN
jgi:hypothetical protein